VRVTTAFKRLLRLDGVNVTSVRFGIGTVTVTVALGRRRLICPHCGFKTRFRYDTRPVESRWRHLDLGSWRLEVSAALRRLRCPAHGVVVEGVPFARVEGLNTKVRLIVRRAYGFHSADAALALVMLATGPITIKLPHEHKSAQATT